MPAGTRTYAPRTYIPPVPSPQTPVILPGGTIDNHEFVMPTTSISAQPSSIAAGAGLGNMRAFAIQTVAGTDQIYVLDGGGNPGIVHVYTMDGTQVNTITVPTSYTGLRADLAVDTSGNVFVTHGNGVIKLSPAGAVLATWTAGYGTNPSSHYSYAGGIATFNGNNAGNVWLDENLTILGGRPTLTAGTYLNAGNPSWNAGSAVPYLAIQDQSGTTNQWIGPVGGTGGINGSALAPDGNYVVSCPNYGVVILRPDGSIVGVVTNGSLTRSDSNNLNGSYLTALMIWKGTLYYFHNFAYGNNPVTSIPYSTLLALALSPKTTTYGIAPGIDLVTAATANYYPSTGTPTVSLTLDNWVTTLHPGKKLTYSIRERDEWMTGAAGAIGTLTVPASTGVNQTVVVPIPVDHQGPGFYRVDAALLRADSTAIGLITRYYAVGCVGATLNFATLPGSVQYSTVAADRNVALSGMLGFGYARVTPRLQDVVPGSGQSGTVVALTTSSYDSVYSNAATFAAANGVIIIGMPSDGSGVDQALVSNGTYGQYIQNLVAHYSVAPYNIKYWECWNEPSTGGYSGQRPAAQPDQGNTPANFAVYVQQVFYNAVKAANATCKVLGPTILDYNLNWHSQFAAAGGYAYVDNVSVHPYTGYSASWEEHGYANGLFTTIKTILVANGAGSKPIIGTEIAFWNNGMQPGGLVVQGDNYTRYSLHGDALGYVGRTAFFAEGILNSNGIYDESMITANGNTGDYVPLPSGLAAMVYSVQTKGRTCTGYVSGCPPHVWGVLYGSRTGDANSVLALWTDDANIPVTITAGLTGAVTVTRILGKTTTLTAAGNAVSLPVDGSPLYLSIPVGQTPTISSSALIGSNVALASLGSTVAVTSDVSTTKQFLIDGISNSQGLTNGYGGGMPAWYSQFPDKTPTATITFARPQNVSSAVVTTHSIESGAPGVRHLDLYGQNSAGNWVFLSSVRDLYFRHQVFMGFTAQALTGLRVVVRGVCPWDYAGGVRNSYLDPTQVATPNNLASLPAVLYEIEAYGAAYTVPVPAWTSALPAGYSHAQRLTVNAGTTALNGSTTTPVTFAGSAATQDSVVTCTLSGIQAYGILDNCVDQTNFTDLSLFYGGTQIDLDFIGKNGAGAGTLTFSFRLQAPIAAGASTSGYVIGFGNASPTVKRNWANIYPLADDFVGSTLDSTKWTYLAGAGLSIANSIATIVGTAAVEATYALDSMTTLGTGWSLQLRAQLPTQGLSTFNLVGFSNGDLRFSNNTGLTTSYVANAPMGFRLVDTLAHANYTFSSVSGTDIAPADNAYHILTTARDTAGVAWGSVDGSASVSFVGDAITSNLKVQMGFYVHNNNYQMAIDWAKVSPYLSGPPTFTLASS